MKKLISIVTPCYNEEANVVRHLERVRAAIEPLRERYDFEHIYTDNCSEDRTFELLCELGSARADVRAIRFSRNIGAERAMLLGLRHAKGDAVVLIHCDLQDPPELIPEFIKGWEGGGDVVFGQIEKREEGLLLQRLRRLYYRIVSTLSDVPIPKNACDFRLTSRRALDAVLQFTEDDPYLRGIVAQVGFKQRAIPYVRQARAGGESSISFVGLFGFAIKGIVSTTVAPIRIVVAVGLLLASLGAFLTVFLVASKLVFKDAIPHGFTTLAALITLFAGAQMCAIGIIGEYVRKTFVQSLQRPPGFIQDRVNIEAREPAPGARRGATP